MKFDFLDGKTSFAILIVLGFVVLTGIGMFHQIPESNVKTIDGAMVALGTALGAAVMALLRNSAVDEKRVDNTARAFDAITATANATTPPPVTVAPDATSVTIGTDQESKQ
jgi:hypothetical protein